VAVSTWETRHETTISFSHGRRDPRCPRGSPAPHPSTRLLPSDGQAASRSSCDGHLSDVPAGTRYTRSGSTITIDYEYLVDGSARAARISAPRGLSLRRARPRNYTVQARLYDIKQPAPRATGSPATCRDAARVVGHLSGAAGAAGYAPAALTIRSAAYFDPASCAPPCRATCPRDDFDYTSGRSAADDAGRMSTYGSVVEPALPPGNYRCRGMGNEDHGGGAAEQYFTREFVVAPPSRWSSTTPRPSTTTS
jgi:hypothetical protein